MGLSASQCRYLALTARQSDLEYQAQTINQARMNLANQSSQAAKAYANGMANKVIRTAVFGKDTQGITTKRWTELTYANIVEQGYQLIGTNGATLTPSPYTEFAEGSTISAERYASLSLSDAQRENFVKNSDGTYSVKKTMRLNTDPSYMGMDIQTLLVSGVGHVVHQAFFDFLCEHGYGTGCYYNTDEAGNKTPTTYKNLVNDWQVTQSPTVVDWRSDQSNMFCQTLYTEDDPMVEAQYEATTAEIQAQDKKLELELKQIETEHKAIQTELESVKKVIEKNIENTYKTFG